MKLRCPNCKEVIERDGRTKEFKASMTKRGYKSDCEKTGKTSYLKPI